MIDKTRVIAPMATALCLLSATAQAAHVTVFDPKSTASANAFGESTGITNGVLDPSYVIDGPGGSTSVQALTASGYSGQANAAVADRSAYALSSLDYGVLRAHTVAGNVPYASAAFAHAFFQDTIHFTNSSGAPAALGLAFLVEGDIVAPNPGWSSYVGGYAQLQITGCGACGNDQGQRITWQDSGKVVGNAPTFNFSTPGIYSVTDFGRPYDASSYQVQTSQSGTHLSGVLVANLVIPTGQTSLGIRAALDLDCRESSVCDFDDTASFGFGALPQGLSYSSLSGVFGSTAPVPEPGTWAMLLAGLALCARAVRRQREAPAQPA